MPRDRHQGGHELRNPSPGLGVLRRLRPVLTRSADSEPSPRHPLAVSPSGGTRTVPVFTAVRSMKEEPRYAPAASPRLPRSTSPWPPDERTQTHPGVPPGLPAGGAHRIRPISARFGVGHVLRDVITRVPL